MENQKPRNLDEAIEAMKQTQPTPEQAHYSTRKVFDQISGEAPAAPERLRSAEDFHALLLPYIKGELSEARRMLLEDQIAKNPALRRRYEELKGNVRVMPPAPARRSAAAPFLPWAVAAGVLLVVGYLSLDTMNQLMAPSGPRAELASFSGEIYKVSAAGLVPVKQGATLGEREALRTAKGSSAVVRLPDGSLIEMNERAELSISAAYTGSTIRLERGNILVQAAKQKRGTLKVATRDSVVNVKGTIFSVAAGLLGTQVAVVEGHVVVEQGGKAEDLRPGQVTGSDLNLKRTTVRDQIAWSKDEAKYLAMVGEMAELSRQIEALPMPALRTRSAIFEALPGDLAIYAAIPNISGTVADATKLFEERLAKNPMLAEWWKSNDVAQMRQMAEQLRTLGSEIGDEVVIAARRDAKGKIGEPFVIAELKGQNVRQALAQFKGEVPMEIGERFVVAGGKLDLNATPQGFANSELGQTVAKSYRQGAGWILAMDLEQFAGGPVRNNMKRLMLERRDSGLRPDTRATVSFEGPRTGIASWLAAPAPMVSLDYVSPQAGFALSAVTKDARQMGEEFLAMTGAAGSTELTELEARLGIRVLDDLLGPLGGEVTFALDGGLVPVPSVVMVSEVYDSSRLSSSIRRIAQEFASKGVAYSEENVAGRTWYRLKANTMPVEVNFTYDNGYVLAGPTRELLTKAMQNRQTGNGLARSTAFKQLIPAGSPVNMSGVIYYNLGPALQSVLNTVKSTVGVPEQQAKAMDQLANAQEAVLIALYADEDRITVASSSGFFGFGLENLLSAGAGAPVMPSIAFSVLQHAAPFMRTGQTQR
jgi:hypothetical protein